jgi:hypothetical protein
VFLKLSRIWGDFNAPQPSISANREVPTQQQKRSVPLDFYLLKLPVFWIAFAYNSAAYAAPKAASPNPPITPQIEGHSPSRQVAVDKAIANPKVEPLGMPFMDMAPPEMMLQPRVEQTQADVLSQENSEANPSEASDPETNDPELGILRLREQELQLISPASDSADEPDDQTTSTETDSANTSLLKLFSLLVG